MSKKSRLMSGLYEGIPWEFFVCDKVFNMDIVTAVACVALKDKEVVIVKNKQRAWEFPGGHVDTDEVWNETVKREVIEEASCEISEPVLFGYQEFFYKKKFKHYPFPKAQILYYTALVTSVLPDEPKNSEEIICRDLVSASVAISRLKNSFQKQLVSYCLEHQMNTAKL